MIYRLSSDLSNITNIPKLCLDNLGNKAADCIAYCVQENLCSKEIITSVDIGIGILHIKFIDDIISYKFVPSAQLENQLSSIVTSKEPQLTLKLDNALVERISSTYKGLY